MAVSPELEGRLRKSSATGVSGRQNLPTCRDGSWPIRTWMAHRWPHLGHRRGSCGRSPHRNLELSQKPADDIHLDREPETDNDSERPPYTTCDCTLNEQSPRCMSKAVQKIRDVAINRLWQVDWDHFEALSEEAQAASTDGDFDRSVRIYGDIIRFFMAQFRNTLANET